VKEVRAWTIHKGDTAPQAAGVIHTDFERGFIRAQTIAFDDFIACKGEHGAKEAGKMRAEGKEYVVKDGDVLNFLFNVYSCPCSSVVEHSLGKGEVARSIRAMGTRFRCFLLLTGCCVHPFLLGDRRWPRKNSSVRSRT
jgi:hypothetical protein